MAPATGVAVLLVPPLAIDNVPVMLEAGRNPVTSDPRLMADQEGFPEALPWRTWVVVPWFWNKAEAKVGVK